MLRLVSPLMVQVETSSTMERKHLIIQVAD